MAVTCLHAVRMEQMGLELKWGSDSADDTCAARVVSMLLEVSAHIGTLTPRCRLRSDQTGDVGGISDCIQVFDFVPQCSALKYHFS